MFGLVVLLMIACEIGMRSQNKRSLESFPTFYARAFCWRGIL